MKLRWSYLVGALLLLPLASAHAAEYYEGMHYQRLPTPAPPNLGQGQVEVVEWFYYGCPHCFSFEPYLNEWLQKKPESAVFVRLPSTINPGWTLMAKAFYAMELLGATDEVHEQLFQAIHEQRRRFRNVDSLARFLAQQGVDEARFREALNSPAVATRIRRAAELSRRHGVSGVPAVVVNGKYLVTATLAGGYDDMIGVIDQLVREESEAL